MAKVVMQSVSVCSYTGSTVGGSYNFVIEGQYGNISVKMTDEEAQEIYALILERGQKAYSQYVGFAIDIPLFRPLCLPAPTVNAEQPETQDLDVLDPPYRTPDDDISW